MKQLDNFYEGLYKLKHEYNQAPKSISILHIGDSHLQAGFLSRTVMHHLYQEFGNAGRGLIIPLKMAKTNEPNDYDIASDVNWKVTKCLNPKSPFPIGIGGLSLMSLEPVFNLDIETLNTKSNKYDFSVINLHHCGKLPDFHLDKSDTKIIQQKKVNEHVTQFTLSKSVNRINFFHTKKTSIDTCIIFGANLERKNKGILYHSVGLNGAQFRHFARINTLAEQANSLSHEIIIFSLGTNEAFTGLLNESILLGEIKKLVEHVKAKKNNTVIILTTPAECRYRRSNAKNYEPNPFIGKIRNTIVKYCIAQDFLYWDLFMISGSDGSSENWIRNNWLARDGVHFEITGYKLKGDLLYQAIINGYNNYVVNRQ